MPEEMNRLESGAKPMGRGKEKPINARAVRERLKLVIDGLSESTEKIPRAELELLLARGRALRKKLPKEDEASMEFDFLWDGHWRILKALTEKERKERELAPHHDGIIDALRKAHEAGDITVEELEGVAASKGALDAIADNLSVLRDVPEIMDLYLHEHLKKLPSKATENIVSALRKHWQKQ
jgi:hypothetical protein